jgi:hypothetical protein
MINKDDLDMVGVMVRVKAISIILNAAVQVYGLYSVCRKRGKLRVESRVGLKRKRFFSFSRKAKIMRKEGGNSSSRAGIAH